jgi:hypothetical protein
MIQGAGNVTRVTKHLHRSVPKNVNSLKELMDGFAVCRVQSSQEPHWMRGGLTGAEDDAVVLVPLQEWSSGNGLFCVGRLIPGQDICLGGAEEVVFPGTGACLVLVLILRLPRTYE